MRRRRFIQYVGLGGLSCALATSTAQNVFASPLTEISSGNSDRFNRKTFDFKVEKVNQKGIVQSHKRYTADYFSVPVDQPSNRSDVAESIDMVAITPGRFLMGTSSSDIPPARHAVKGNELLSHRMNVSSFFMSKYAITQAQWAAVAALPTVNRELDPNPSHFQGADYPVESVSWLAAIEFCARLSQHTGKTYRLPTEVEWEYACRAGTQTPFHTGKTITSQHANYVGTYTYKAERPGEYRQSPVSVGSFSPNAFGLYDMHGNVWEWCSDRWHPRYQPQAGLAPTPLRTIRGGSWSDSPVNLRSASRSGYVETGLNRTIGFRVVTT